MRRFLTVFATIGLLGALAPRAGAQTPDPMSQLLQMMTDKGMLSEQEAQKVRDAAAALRAQSETNQVATEAAAASKIKTGFRGIELTGDVRFRYEARNLETPLNDRLNLDRFRYALRLGVKGELPSDLNYGLRLETAANPRSSWVSFGASSSGVPYQGPMGKSTAGLNLSQIYLGWKPESWVDLTLGKFPNPLYTTAMVWDPDLNPEGASERFHATVGKADFFANFGQFLYEDVNPSHVSPFIVPSVPFGQDKTSPFLLAWQGGVTYHFTKDVFLKAAATLYNYTGTGQDTAPGGTPAVPGFPDNFVGEGGGLPIEGASGYPLGPNDGFAFNQTGIDHLLVLETPFEFDFKIASLNARLFGDFSENLDGSARAAAAVAGASTNNLAISLTLPFQPHENKAYQFGFGVGNSDTPGLTTGAMVKRGAWEAKAYWQHVEQYALDPNLLDSDFFEGRGNLQGVYSALAYGFTDSVIGTVRYGYASRINKLLGTGGANQDVPQVNPIDQYQILQVDLTWKF